MTPLSFTEIVFISSFIKARSVINFTIKPSKSIAKGGFGTYLLEIFKEDIESPLRRLAD